MKIHLRKWAGNGLLGATVRFDDLSEVSNYGIRILVKKFFLKKIFFEVGNRQLVISTEFFFCDSTLTFLVS